MKRALLGLCSVGVLSLGLIGPASALPTPLDGTVLDVTVGPYVGHFSVTLDNPSLCSDCGFVQDDSKLGITITRSGSNDNNLVQFGGPITEFTATVSAWVTNGALNVPILGGIYSVTGTGVANTTPADPYGGTGGSISPGGTSSLTLSFVPPFTASQFVTYDNFLDFSARRGGALASFTEDLIVATPEPASAGLMMFAIGSLALGRRRRARR
jgi:hypothetical protein